MEADQRLDLGCFSTMTKHIARLMIGAGVTGGVIGVLVFLAWQPLIGMIAFLLGFAYLLGTVIRND